MSGIRVPVAKRPDGDLFPCRKLFTGKKSQIIEANRPAKFTKGALLSWYISGARRRCYIYVNVNFLLEIEILGKKKPKGSV